LTQLLKYEGTCGRFPGAGSRTADGFLADGEHVHILAERDPARLPWKARDVDVVVESTGLFRDASEKRAHLDAGARRGVITAPAKHEDLTVVLGVNERRYDPESPYASTFGSAWTTRFSARTVRARAAGEWRATRNAMPTFRSRSEDVGRATSTNWPRSTWIRVSAGR